MVPSSLTNDLPTERPLWTTVFAKGGRAAQSDDEVHRGLLPNPVRHAPTACHSTVAATSTVGLGLVDHSVPIYRACASGHIPEVDHALTQPS